MSGKLIREISQVDSFTGESKERSQLQQLLLSFPENVIGGTNTVANNLIYPKSSLISNIKTNHPRSESEDNPEKSAKRRKEDNNISIHSESNEPQLYVSINAKDNVTYESCPMISPTEMIKHSESDFFAPSSSCICSANTCAIERIISYKTDVIELINGLTKNDVRKLQNAIDFPARLMEECEDPNIFIFELKNFDSYNPGLFLEALQNLNPTLVPLAKNIPFLTTSPSLPEATDEISRDMCMFVRMLRDDITVTEWRTILIHTDYPIRKAFEFKQISKFCLGEGIISRDLSFLQRCFRSVKREDLFQRIPSYKQKFSFLTEREFKDVFMNELHK